MFSIDEFISILKSLKGSELFNPYTDTCPINDEPNSHEIREKNLRKYLKAIYQTNTLIVGEAPGYLGCRRTGLPFTDNRHLEVVQQIYGLERLEIATTKGKDKEQSALFMWRVNRELKHPPFVYNIVPLHPYKKGKPLSNRTPRKSDYENTKAAITYLLENGGFKQVLAIGRVSEKHLKELGYDAKYIRHPAQGGSNEFTELMNKYLE